MLTIISFFTLLALSLATPQYPPSGWRPRGTPFVLPREYLPSAPIKAAAQHEINRERFDYIGQYQIREPYIQVRSNFEQPESQLQQNQIQPQIQFQSQSQPQQQQPQPQFQPQPQQVQQTYQPQPHTTYLTPSPDIQTTTEQFVDDISTTTEPYYTTTFAPTTENFLKVQGLPSVEKPAPFRDVNKRVSPLNNKAQQQNVKFKSGQLNQQPQLQRNDFQQARQQQGPKGQITLVNTESAKSGKQVAPNQITNTYGAPQIATSSPAVFTLVNTYGAPGGNNQPNDAAFAEKSPKNEAEDKSNSNETTEDSAERQGGGDDVPPQTNIAVSNAIDTNGQYYILNPDNMLQRVIFMTTANQEDAGFTAQLKYMPVEPIRDPIYAYNENGQLVRIFRK